MIAPPYDVLSSSEARALAQDLPWSLLHVTKPEIDFPADAVPDGPAIHGRAGVTFRRMLEEGILRRDPSPCYYVYRLTMGSHVQTGLALTASIKAYRAMQIRRHEFTRPDKEDDRVLNISTVNAQTEPVLLVHRADDRLAALIDAAIQRPPAVNLTARDGIGHTLWTVEEAERIAALSERLDRLDALYIADGHHRCAAAARIAEERQADSSDYFLAVAFPAEAARILDYNRLCRDLGGLSEAGFVEALGERFEIAPVHGPLRPARAHEFGMILGSQWYRLRLRESLADDRPVIERLDVSLLANHVLKPIFGITDPRTDPRIEFVGGIRGLDALELPVRAGDAAVGFALFPTAIDDLMAVADTGAVMPPKSTWFEPKLADGLVSYPLD